MRFVWWLSFVPALLRTAALELALEADIGRLVRGVVAVCEQVIDRRIGHK